MAKEIPLVSVIMPAYNAEKYVEEAINSILNQTYKNFELIILDDASTDNTPLILKNLAKKDPRIRYIRNEKNLYIAGNRNKGISLAKGKYILWQDADDISLPNRIEKLLSFMEEHPKTGICGSYLQSFYKDKIKDIRKYPQRDKIIRENLFKFSPIAQPTAIIKKECFDKIGNFDIDMPPAEDIDLTFRIGTLYKFANIPEVLLMYREHPDSATYTKMKRIISNTLKIRKKYSKGFGYKMNFSDKIAYLITKLALIVPPKIVIYIFKLLRTFITLYKKDIFK